MVVVVKEDKFHNRYRNKKAYDAVSVSVRKIDAIEGLTALLQEVKKEKRRLINQYRKRASRGLPLFDGVDASDHLVKMDLLKFYHDVLKGKR